MSLFFNSKNIHFAPFAVKGREIAGVLASGVNFSTSKMNFIQFHNLLVLNICWNLLFIRSSVFSAYSWSKSFSVYCHLFLWRLAYSMACSSLWPNESAKFILEQLLPKMEISICYDFSFVTVCLGQTDLFMRSSISGRLFPHNRRTSKLPP